MTKFEAKIAVKALESEGLALGLRSINPLTRLTCTGPQADYLDSIVDRCKDVAQLGNTIQQALIRHFLAS